jgi:GT2 family glycosyltransferase
VAASASGSLIRDRTIAGAAVAVVIVNYRTPELAKRCVAALQSERKLLPKLRAVVVDGGSGDGSAEDLAKVLAEPEYRQWVSFVPLPINGGFGWANNQAILALARESSPPDYIHLLNPDAEVTEGAVARLVEELDANPGCAAAGSQLLTSDGHAVPSAFRFPSPGRELVTAAQSESLGRWLGVAPTVVQANEGTEVDWVTGASVILRSEALRQSGLFDDGFFLYFEEVELMHRLRSEGWTIRHAPQSRVTHLEGAATGVNSAAVQPMPAYWYESRRRYFTLTGGVGAALAADLALIAGRAVAFAKSVLRGLHVAGRVRLIDLFRTPRDEGPRSAPVWGDPPGKPPAWMSRP